MAIAPRQASTAMRPTLSWYMLCFFFLIITLGTVNSSPPTTLVLYNHQKSVPPNQTDVIVVSPSGNFTAFDTFGSIGIISNPLREGAANDSPLLGVIDGQVIVERGPFFFTAVTFVLDTKRFSGSISAQGVLTQPGNGEVAITGGTGDFRWARGYVDFTTVSQDPEDTVFKAILHIKYD